MSRPRGHEQSEPHRKQKRMKKRRCDWWWNNVGTGGNGDKVLDKWGWWIEM